MLNLLTLFTQLLQPNCAHARVYDMYRADYPRSAFCVAVGNACVAETAVENSFYQNPAALTSGEEDWNFDGDYSSHSNLEPGQRASDASESRASGGVGYSHGRFGYAVAFYWQRDYVNAPLTVYDDSHLPRQTSVTARSLAFQVKVPLSYQLQPGWSVGVALALFKHSQEIGVANSTSGAPASSHDTKLGLSIGTNVHLSERLYFGSWLRLPRTLYESVGIATTVASTSISYQEDFALHYPWIWANGVEFHPQDRLVLFGEADLIGPTKHGRLLSYNILGSGGSARDGLVNKGHFLVIEPHGGARYSFTPKLKVHGGSYYEPSRTEDTHGRLHGTGGVSYAFSEWFELIGGFDVAKDFSQFLLSFR
jgi:hypothetical protein